MVTYVVPWWSPSKFVCWDQCPQLFYERYVMRVPTVPTLAMSFGTAVHRGLEQHYRGADGELGFRREWRQLCLTLTNVDPGLSRMGLDLVEKVIALGLAGEPEKKVWIRTDAYLDAPLLGYIDLWCPGTNTIVDFKTTVGSWTQERAEKEVWQPCLYSWDRYQESGVLPKFEYIVLNRVTGALDRFTTQRSGEQIADCLGRARAIAVEVAAGRFDCRCRTGVDCPECGAKWEHSHQCDLATGLRIRLKAKVA